MNVRLRMYIAIYAKGLLFPVSLGIIISPKRK